MDLTNKYYKEDLCDSESCCKLYNPLLTRGECHYYNEWCELKDDVEQKNKTIADLEAKLAESERQYQEYRQIVEKDIEKEIDERMRDTIKEFNLDISQLKQQLAEKEKEIETLKKCGDTDHFYGLLEDKMREIYICRKYIKKQDKDKISFCIEQLEKVKNTIANIDMPNNPKLYNDDMFQSGYDVHYVKVRKIIDNQIEELKKESNNEEM